MNPIINFTGLNVPDFRRPSGESARKFLSATGRQTLASLLNSWRGSTDRRQPIVIELSSVEHPSFEARALVWEIAAFFSPKAKGESSLPLIAIAWWKRFLDNGDKTSSPTLDPPALSPNIVTLDLSPPKALMFSCTHFSASIWSSIP